MEKLSSYDDDPKAAMHYPLATDAKDALRLLDSKERHDHYTTLQYENKKRSFFCGVPDEKIPDDILSKVLQSGFSVQLCGRKMVNVTDSFARHLQNNQLITYESYEQLTKPHMRHGEKIAEIIRSLEGAGRQPRTLVKFYDCLLNVIIALNQMILAVAPLVDPLSEEDCLDICRHLGIQEDVSSLEKSHSLGAICGEWLVKKEHECSPSKFIEALLLTKGTGRHLSGICYPHNPPEVRDFMMRLGEHDFEKIPQYLGYTCKPKKNSIPLDQKIDRFLKKWKMPSTGDRQRNVELLSKLASLARIPGVCRGDSMQERLFEVLETQSLKSESTLSDKTRSEDIPKSTVQSSEAPIEPVSETGGQGTADTSSQPEETETRSGSEPPVEVEVAEPQVSNSSQSVGEIEEEEELTPPQPHPVYEDIEESNDDILLTTCSNPSNFDLVNALLESGKKQNVVRASDGSHALHIAVKSGSEKIVQCLLDHGAHIDCRNKRGQTVLMIACMEKNFGMVKYLVEKRADPNLQSNNGYGCLHFKETLESLETVRYLAEEGGAEVDIQTYDDRLTPLTRLCVIDGSNIGSLEYLLEKRANPNGVDGAHMRPLCAAAAAGHDDYIIPLLNQRANVNIRNKDGSTPLLKACQHMRFEIVSMLFKYDVDIRCKANDGTSPVMAAVENNSVELLEMLLHDPLNPDLHAVKTIGDSNSSVTLPVRGRGVGRIFPLGLAAARGRQDIVEKLIAAGANMNLSPDGSLPTIAFAMLSNSAVHVAEYLLNHALLDKGIKNLGPALIVAIHVGNLPLVYKVISVLGGMEKTVIMATNSGDSQLLDNLLNFQDMTKDCEESMVSYQSDEPVRSKPASAAVTPSTSSWMTSQSPYHAPYASSSMVQDPGVEILEEFTQYAIQSTASNEAERTLLIETARNFGLLDVVGFFTQYFMNPTLVENVFGQFIRCNPEYQQPSPGRFMFDYGQFSAVKFKQLLTSFGRHDLLVKVELALLAFPASETVGCQTGKDILIHLFGRRFYDEVYEHGVQLLDNTAQQAVPVPKQVTPRFHPTSFTSQTSMSLPQRDNEIENRLSMHWKSEYNCILQSNTALNQQQWEFNRKKLATCPNIFKPIQAPQCGTVISNETPTVPVQHPTADQTASAQHHETPTEQTNPRSKPLESRVVKVASPNSRPSQAHDRHSRPKQQKPKPKEKVPAPISPLLKPPVQYSSGGHTTQEPPPVTSQAKSTGITTSSQPNVTTTSHSLASKPQCRSTSKSVKTETSPPIKQKKHTRSSVSQITTSHSLASNTQQHHRTTKPKKRPTHNIETETLPQESPSVTHQAKSHRITTLSKTNVSTFDNSASKTHPYHQTTKPPIEQHTPSIETEPSPPILASPTTQVQNPKKHNPERSDAGYSSNASVSDTSSHFSLSLSGISPSGDQSQSGDQPSDPSVHNPRSGSPTPSTTSTSSSSKQSAAIAPIPKASAARVPSQAQLVLILDHPRHSDRIEATAQPTADYQRSQSDPVWPESRDKQASCRRSISVMSEVSSVVFKGSMKLSDAPTKQLQCNLRALKRSPKQYVHYTLEVLHKGQQILEPDVKYDASDEDDKINDQVTLMFLGIPRDKDLQDDSIVHVLGTAICYQT